MKVVSLNLSMVKAVQWQGKTVTTGIFKQPVDNKVYVDKNNVEGDAQADLSVHGGEYKAVYAFSANHYEAWKKSLSRLALPYGTFGENLTITDLNETDLCIGDQLAIGDCVLEVSQPRVPCFKLGIALDNPKIPNLFTKSWNTGVYFKVVKPGFICPDNEVEVIKRATNSVTLQALFRAYYDRDFADSTQVLETALTIDALAPEWQKKAAKKLAQRQ